MLDYQSNLDPADNYVMVTMKQFYDSHHIDPTIDVQLRNYHLKLIKGPARKQIYFQLIGIRPVDNSP